jgi:glycosyltransferase involved in cell wall biosynthesis
VNAPELSVVIPAYQEAARLSPTIDALVDALRETDFQAEVVIVDDGSTDGTADAARLAVAGRLPMRVLSQANRGRFYAVLRGLQDARGRFVLIVGSRVRLRPGSLAFLRERQRAGELVWTGHVHVETSMNAYGAFQNVLTELAWRDYFANPRTLSFGVEEFDRYPKGSGCFFAPRELLLDAFASFRTRYGDMRHANDDTPILRAVAARERIHISPRFAADYAARGTLRTFVEHSVHRGIVFLDGHGRRESRFFPVAAAFYPVSAALAISSARRPRRSIAAVAAVSLIAGLTAAAVRRSRFEIAATALLAPVWAAAFGVGLWRGLWMMSSLRLGVGRKVGNGGC